MRACDTSGSTGWQPTEQLHMLGVGAALIHVPGGSVVQRDTAPILAYADAKSTVTIIR